MKMAWVSANTPFPRFFQTPGLTPRAVDLRCEGDGRGGQTTPLRRQLTLSRAPGYCRLMPGVMAAHKAATLSEDPALISGLSVNPSVV
jgi:hypothetical protein